MGNIEKIIETLPTMYTELKKALPNTQLTPERLGRMAITILKDNEKLAMCNPISIYAGIMKAAQLGLELGSTIGECFLVPYKGYAQFQIGYQGMKTLVERSGLVHKIQARVVRDNDEFDYIEGTTEEYKHVRNLDKLGNFKLVYAIAEGRNGVKYHDIMIKEEIDKIRNASPNADGPAWRNYYDEMAKAKIIKRLCKVLPKSTNEDSYRRLQMNIANDETISENFDSHLKYPDEVEVVNATVTGSETGSAKTETAKPTIARPSINLSEKLNGKGKAEDIQAAVKAEKDTGPLQVKPPSISVPASLKEPPQVKPPQVEPPPVPLQGRPRQVKSPQVKSDQVKPPQVKPPQVKPLYAKPPQVKPPQVKPNQDEPPQIKLPESHGVPSNTSPSTDDGVKFAQAILSYKNLIGPERFDDITSSYKPFDSVTPDKRSELISKLEGELIC